MSKLGLQLYSLRDLTRHDFLGTIAKVAQVGYRGVEFAGYVGVRAAVLRQTLLDNGLLCAGAVTHMSVLERGLESAVEYASIIASPAIVVPGLPEPYRLSLDTYRQAADRLNEIGAYCKRNSLLLVYHIHGFEFTDFGGQTGMDVLLERCDAQVAPFQADVYWIEHAGVDSVAFLKRYGARCPYIHAKDMADRVSKRDTEVGAGVIDMMGVVREAVKNDAAWLTVEQEEMTLPPFESIAISLRNLQSLYAAAGGKHDA